MPSLSMCPSTHHWVGEVMAEVVTRVAMSPVAVLPAASPPGKGTLMMLCGTAPAGAPIGRNFTFGSWLVRLMRRAVNAVLLVTLNVRLYLCGSSGSQSASSSKTRHESGSMVGG